MFALKRDARAAFIICLLALGGTLACAAPNSDVSDDRSFNSLQSFAASIEHRPPRSWITYVVYAAKRIVKRVLRRELGVGTGVYLGHGFVITAAHVVGSDRAPMVLIAGEEMPAEVVKKGEFAKRDLTLLRVDQKQLPVKLGLRRMPICHSAPLAGDAVLVATPERISRSSVISTAELPASVRGRFPTAIRDVATTGNSGSGVFDEASGCLLGIVSRKIFVTDSNGTEHDIAKFFVPPSKISSFLQDIEY